MELNDRKLKILEAIIADYLHTAEPVGSRTISKNYNLGVSPATIRNEMSDLEDLGLIVQPYTSSGRIPSDKGYRLYVDMLMSAKNNNERHNKHVTSLLESANRIENILMEIANILAKETNLTAVVSTPHYKKSTIKSIQLMLIDNSKVLAVILTDGNVASNYIFDIDKPIKRRQLTAISTLLNDRLKGLHVEEINLPMIEDLKMLVGEHVEVVTKVLEKIFQSVNDKNSTSIFTSGTLNMLRTPEFRDFEKATEIIEAFEKKDRIRNLLLSTVAEETINNNGITVKIGSESGIQAMSDCSIITTSYHINGRPMGIIGVIGPKRMDYENAIISLKCLIKDMERKMNDSEL